MIVKLDVDGVLRNFTLGVHLALREQFPDRVREEPPLITDWGIERFYPDFEEREFWNLVFRSELTYGLFLTSPPYEGAREFTRRLKEKCSIYIVTHQPTVHSGMATLAWLERQDIFYTDVILSRNFPKELLPGVLVDDKPENLNWGDILVTQPWNVRYDWDGPRANAGSPPNVVNFDDLLRVIDERISLGFH